MYKRKWQKTVTAVLGFAVLCTTVSQQTFAYSVPDVVSVGLESVCKNKTTASIGSTSLLIGTEKNGRFSEDGRISSSRGFTVVLKSGEFVATEEMSQEDALDLAENLNHLGYDVYPAYLGGDWSVYVENSSVSEVESDTRMDASRVGAVSGVLLEGSKETNFFPKDSNAVFMGEEKEDTFSINGKYYRGMLSFAINGSVMTAVNTVSLEEYLYGVVPSEMPQSYEKEALKAQAVAARTYAMTKLGAHSAAGYQLCDTTNCQVYKGYSGEGANATAAVDATQGKIACYNGVPIEAVFSASTGGYSENSENVWNATVPYLRAVPVKEEYGNNQWTVTLTLDDLDSLLDGKNANIGNAEDIVITKLSTGGRIQEMKIVGSRGEVALTKEIIRTYFSATSSGSLPGKMFTINGKGGDIGTSGRTTQNAKGGSLATAAEKSGIVAKTEGALSSIDGKSLTVTMENDTKTTTATSDGKYEVYSVNISTVNSREEFVFNGTGKGHGVGLSQNGAQAMAKAGSDYEEILKYFYTGITIEG